MWLIIRITETKSRFEDTQRLDDMEVRKLGFPSKLLSHGSVGSLRGIAVQIKCSTGLNV